MGVGAVCSCVSVWSTGRRVVCGAGVRGRGQRGMCPWRTVVVVLVAREAVDQELGLGALLHRLRCGGGRRVVRVRLLPRVVEAERLLCVLTFLMRPTVIFTGTIWPSLM